jgi:pimeloyl-ACP methyl ester carboxylesterase
MKLHYKHLNGPEKTPLLIVHGLFGNLDNWLTLGKKFSEHTNVYLIDQRNHGHSPHSDAFNYDIMANDLYELILGLTLSKVDIIGHSMGGKAAMRLAQLHPEVIHKLVVVDIGPKGYPMHHDVILEGLNALDFDFIKTRGEADAALSHYIPDDGVRQFLLKNLFWKEKGILAWRMNLPVLTATISDIIGALPADKVSIETLFIRGEKSNYILESDYSAIYEQFPHSDIETVYNAGHWVHAENPLDFHRAVMEFLG